MRKLAKYVGMTLLVAGLAACDGKTDEKSAVNTDKEKPAATAPATTATPTATATATQQMSLLDGKVTFTLPQGMSDQSGKLGGQSNNMHVYADDSGQKAVIVLVSDNTPESLEVLAGRLEEQQRSRDPELQVIVNKAVKVSDQTMQQFDSLITAAGQKAYSSIVLGKVDGKLLTMQITLPAENQQQSQADAETIVKTLKVQ